MAILGVIGDREYHRHPVRQAVGRNRGQSGYRGLCEPGLGVEFAARVSLGRPPVPGRIVVGLELNCPTSQPPVPGRIVVGLP